MTPEEQYRFTDEEEESEDDEDCLGSRLTILRDIMNSYDTSFIWDIRDDMYRSKLNEALVFTGISLRSRTRVMDEDAGMFGCRSELKLSYGGESLGYVGEFRSSDRNVSAVVSLRVAFHEAGLIVPMNDVSGMGGFTFFPEN